MKIKKRIFSLALAGALALGLVPAFSMTALADGDTSYTLTIPSTLTVANSGWNATDGISATGTLASGKKLTVTAASANSWALKSGDNSVGYNLATATGAYSSSATPASWAFTELSNTATTKSMGIIVDDYSSKPAGTYQDTVTFTAAVENAVTTRTVTWNRDDITSTSQWAESFTKDGVTITATVLFNDKMLEGYPATFTTESGKFTKIEIVADAESPQYDPGTGWSGYPRQCTWTGDASSSVSFNGIIDMSHNMNSKIVFTIEE